MAAGLAAAFSAPIAGALFLVEEITFDFKPQKVVAVLAATFSADFVTILAFGNKPFLYLPVNDYLPLIGIFLEIMAYIYQYVLLSLKPWFSKIKKIPAAYHSIIPLILIIPVGLFNAHLLGGSHVLIDNLFNLNWNVKAFGSWDFFYYRSYS